MIGKIRNIFKMSHRTWFVSMFGFSLSVVLGISCRSSNEALWPRTQPEIAASSAAQANYTVLRIFYGTDRIITGDPAPSRYFGNNRGTETTLGFCDVSVPLNHKYGVIERPSIWRLEFREDPARDIVLKSVTPESSNEFYSELADSVNESPENDLLIFIHGFNVTFEQAAQRTAQMAYDLNFKGTSMMYSWPSHASLTFFGYTADETEAQWAWPDVRNFLSDVARKSGAKRIYIIAHSMGNFVLGQALTSIQNAMAPGDAPIFNQVLLAAPDIDRDVFIRDIAPRIQRVAGHVTLYASSSDLALKYASDYIHSHRRAGDSTDGICLVKGIDSIDCSALSTDFPWHSSYGDALLDDIHDLIENDLPAAKRARLKEFGQDIKYWVFPP